MAKRKPDQNKAVRKAETKLDLRAISADQATLERNATFPDPAGGGGEHKTSVCYNRSCPDYRRERHGAERCACSRTSVQGAGR